MKTFLSVFYGLILLAYTGFSKDNKNDSEIYLTIKRFSFGSEWETNKNSYITFKDNPPNKYSLYCNALKLEICKDIYYVKPLNGKPKNIKVYLINNRYVAYPETPLFHGKKAVTHIYDLNKKKLIFTTDFYRYHNDIPILLEMDTI